MPNEIRIVEVGARDGLQNEPSLIGFDLNESIKIRARFVIALCEAGLSDVEAGAFVRPPNIPQMYGTKEVLQTIQKERPDIWNGKKLWCLVPNEIGLDHAIEAGAKHISVFTATSDTFNRKNINMSVDESLIAIKKIVQRALKEKIQVRGYISTVWGCPYEGKTNTSRTKSIAEQMLEWGIEEISLGDTIGVATPNEVSQVLKQLPDSWPLAGHFHDTRGTALANCLRAVDEGILTLDASAGGLGGCPYAKGASGNVATEDLLYMLRGMNRNSRVDLDKLCLASQALSDAFSIKLPSRYHSAWQKAKKD